MEAFQGDIDRHAKYRSSQWYEDRLNQASPLAMRNLRKRLDINKDKLIDIIHTHGNQVSASLPTALHVCLSSKAKRGDRILLLGTGAGLTISGAVLVY
ncbi:MAG: hypothetical protein JNM24_17535 [Bdellovibrionaceae bacterium]|nr:hypothetical protein [Pseudobdellovibrionaceae bacterium]